MKTTTYECPKCNGTGFIRDFSNIANGVCFTCKGAGKVSYKPTVKKIVPLTDCLAKTINTIKTADLSTMSYAQLKCPDPPKQDEFAWMHDLAVKVEQCHDSDNWAWSLVDAHGGIITDGHAATASDAWAKVRQALGDRLAKSARAMFTKPATN